MCSKGAVQVIANVYYIVWREKEIRAVYMDNLRGFLGMRRTDRAECTNKRPMWSDKRGC